LDIDEVEVGEVENENKADDTYYNIKESPYRIKVDNLLKYVTSGKVDFEAEFKVCIYPKNEFAYRRVNLSN
jgi:hypothetical protein